MAFLGLLWRAFLRMLLDTFEWIKDMISHSWDYFLELENSIKLYFLGAVFFFAVLVLPLVSYEIFSEIHYIRHPHFYLAPLALLLAFIGSFVEAPASRWLRLLAYFLYFFLFVTSVFIHLILPDTLSSFSYSYGFWAVILAFFVLTAGQVLSFLER